MSAFRSICVNSQTPLLRFQLTGDELADRLSVLPDPAPLEAFVEGIDYVPTAGGVVQVVRPLLSYLLEKGEIDRAHWLSIAPTGPYRVQDGKITVHGVSLEPEGLAAYTRAKERLWNILHGLTSTAIDPADFSAFARYNWECTRAMFQLGPDVDLYFIHDFQQMQTGAMIGLSAPAVMRWHIPIAFTTLPPVYRRFILRGLEDFDAVIVSCRRDLEGLIAAGFHGKAYQVYPELDPKRFPPVSDEQRQRVASRLLPGGAETTVLCVGRMDPMKGQDALIRAFAKVADQFPRARLVLVGNGSFTSAASGGLAHSKGTTWRTQLQRIARESGAADRVLLPGYVNQEELQAAYALSDIVVLPSVREGFGLVVPEAWMYSKPTIVSQGAGVSELIVDGRNGLTYPSTDVDRLSEHLRALLADPALRHELGSKGHDTAPICFPENRVPETLAILKSAREEYRGAR